MLQCAHQTVTHDGAMQNWEIGMTEAANEILGNCVMQKKNAPVPFPIAGFFKCSYILCHMLGEILLQKMDVSYNPYGTQHLPCMSHSENPHS